MFETENSILNAPPPRYAQHWAAVTGREGSPARIAPVGFIAKARQFLDDHRRKAALARLEALCRGAE